MAIPNDNDPLHFFPFLLDHGIENFFKGGVVVTETTTIESTKLSKVETTLRFTMGIIFVLTGLNGFFNFMSMGEPAPDGMAFMGAIIGTGYLFPFIKVLEIATGLSMITNKFVPLFLAMVFPLTLNIVLFHLFLDPAGIFLGLVLFIVNLTLAWLHRDAYRAMLVSNHPINNHHQ